MIMQVSSSKLWINHCLLALLLGLDLGSRLMMHFSFTNQTRWRLEKWTFCTIP
jgi:hypothetical protein